MIDILGMLLPGGLMLLLLEVDFEVLGIMGKYFGFESGNLLWIAIFLCASYFLGMLLHELGSVIEKLMWRNPLLNPRIYAAVSTDLLFNYAKDKDVPPPEEFSALETGKSIAQKLETKWKWFSELRKNPVANTIGNVIRMIWRFGLSLLAWWVAYYAVGELTPKEYISYVSATFIVCILLQWKSFSKFMVAAFDKTMRERMHQIIKDERFIQKESVTSEENSRKYGLFCGYYSLMRSILVLMAILQVYVSIHVGTDKTDLVQFYEMVEKLPAYPYLRYVVVAALVLRYWHYACAKYTYTYNGYIHNKLYPKEEAKAARLNVELKQVSQVDVHKKIVQN